MSRNKPIPQPPTKLKQPLQPKQYRLKHRSTLFGEESYLNRFIGTDTCILENGHGNDLYQTAFTVEEIGEMVKEFDVLYYFEMKEVTDYD